MKRVILTIVAAAAIGAAPPRPEPPEPAAGAAEEGVAVGVEEDQSTRLTVPVSIAGSGPFRFVVDTGAERTVIARELAQNLQLGEAGTARVHSMTEVSDIPTVLIPALEIGGRQVKGIRAPALERRNLGASGMLGVDSLQSQRVSFDFQREVMTVVPSRKTEESWIEGAIVVSARSRFGHLILVDASVDGQRVWVIVDTGAQLSVGNSLLRDKLARKKRLRVLAPVDLLSVTGGHLTAEASLVKHIRLGDVDIYDMPVAFSDVHPFRQLGLMDRPALLLGMDALRLFERVSVDFANRRVRLLAKRRSGLGPSVQTASAY